MGSVKVPWEPPNAHGNSGRVTLMPNPILPYVTLLKELRELTHT